MDQKPSPHFVIAGKNGFTLLELMVIAGIAGIGLLLFTQGLLQYLSNSTQLREKVENSVDAKRFSAFFVPTIESSNIAVQFQHLPIEVKAAGACAALSATVERASPLLKKLDSANLLKCVDRSDSAISSFPDAIEFFRDSDAVLKSYPMTLGKNAATLQSNPPLSLSSSVIQGNYYATWPLIDQSSPPLLILKSIDQSVSLTYELASANASPPAAQQRRALFRSSNPSLSSASLVGTVLLIYNLAQPTHYFFQIISEALACNPGSSMPPPCDTAGVPITATSGHFALGLEPVTSVIGQFDQTYWPAYPSSPSLPFNLAADSPSGSGDTYLWKNAYSATNNQLSSFYPFATEVFSLSTPTSGAGASSAFDPVASILDPTKKGVDLRRIAAFYQAQGVRVQFVGIPVQMTAYYLMLGSKVKAGTPGVQNKYSLVQKHFRYASSGPASSLTQVLMDDLPGSIAIARKIGTQTFSAFIYQ